MREGLEKEKRAITTQWSKREKSLEKIVINSASMYGSVQGVTGATFPELKSLQLTGLIDGK